MKARLPYEKLPALGEWNGPIHGEFGVLANDGTRAQCHICGKWFHLLAVHVVRTHHVASDEYRALFGLRATAGLVGPALREVRRRLYRSTLEPIQANNATHVASMTAEQRRAYKLGRPWRLQSAVRERRIGVPIAVRGEFLRSVGHALVSPARPLRPDVLVVAAFADDRRAGRFMQIRHSRACSWSPL